MTGAGDDLAARVGERIGHRFTRGNDLTVALTHASASGEGNYERLEFLGDRVLGLIVAQLLFETFPHADEGELSRRFNALVNAETLAEIAAEIGLHEFVVAGREMKGLTGRNRVNLRADVMESLIAAVYLDGGMEAARQVVVRYWRGRLHNVAAARRDPKTELQEWAHRASGGTPSYEVESRSGPDHAPVFTVSVTVRGFAPERGVGRSKREAEQNAATALLIREGVWAKDGTEEA